MIENYKLKLKVLTPVHIGSGETIGKSEYVINGGRAYILDTYKLFKGLTQCGALKKYEDSVMKIKGFSLNSFFQTNNIPSSKYKDWALYSFEIPEDANSKQLNISSCVKDAYHKPYIPGSSLKGALRTAVEVNELLDGKAGKYSQRVKDEIPRLTGRKSDMSYVESDMDVELFHTLKLLDRKPKDKNNSVNSIFKGLRISDSSPVELDDLALCVKIDLDDGDGENALNVVRECIKPGTELTFGVSIDTDIFSYDAKKLLGAVKRSFDLQAERFLSHFNDVDIPSADNVIYIGGGTGFVSKTVVQALFNEKDALYVTKKILDKQFYKHHHLNDKYVSPRMRKCTYYDNGYMDMGMCEMSFEKV